MRKVLLLLFVVVLAVSCAYAAEEKSGCWACSNLKSDNIHTVYGARICNGLSNTALGWSEIFFRPGKLVSAGENPVVAFLKSLGNAIGRTGAGVVELVTFWMPGESVVKIDDCPICSYK